MGCKVLSDRKGKPACGIKGRKGDHASTMSAVDITDSCDLEDIGAKVVLTYANGSNRRLTVKVGVEQRNGEEYRCWSMKALKNGHREDEASGKKRNYVRLKSFISFAKQLGIKPVVLANLIIDKSP